MVDIQENLKTVHERIEKTCQNAGRNPDDLQLVVVTKEKSAAIVKELVEAGVSRIGESYVQEATFKMELLSDLDIRWHMVGHVQSGKANQVAANFDYVHSVDSLDIAEILNRSAQRMGRVLPVLLECNVSGEESKYGWDAQDEGEWHRVAEDLSTINQWEHIKVEGLMTMAPYHPDPEESRPYFKKLKHLQEWLAGQFPAANLQELSMGMSADYRVAIEEGASILRVGSAIVGPRE